MRERLLGVHRDLPGRTFRVELAAPLSKESHWTISVTENRALPLDLVFPDGNVLLELARHFFDERGSDATRDVCAADLFHTEVETNVHALAVDRCDRAHEQCFDHALEANDAEPEAVGQTLDRAVHVAPRGLHPRPRKHAKNVVLHICLALR